MFPTPFLTSSASDTDSYPLRRFSNLFGGNSPVDRVRNQHLPTTSPTLDYLDEAFTSENWLVRIYQVKKEDFLGRDLKSANAFSDGKKRKKLKPPVKRKSIAASS